MSKQILEELKKIVESGNGISRKQMDQLILSSMVNIVETQDKILKRLEPIEDMKKKLDTFPNLLWPLMEDPKTFITIIIIASIILSQILISEFREFWLYLLGVNPDFLPPFE